MAGTVAGGKQAAATNKQRYGMNFYVVIGGQGGKASTTGGFAQNRELAKMAGQRGGRASRRRRPDEMAVDPTKMVDTIASEE